MKKPQVYTLDTEEDEYAGRAFLFFHTTEPGYSFADDLNRLYSLSLTRRNDISLRDAQWPVYAYIDTVACRQFYLVERPASSDKSAAHWGVGHKMLIITGDDAYEWADLLCHDFGTPHPEPDSSDLLGAERYAILCDYQARLTTVTLLELGSAPPQAKKAAKERAELEALMMDIMDFLDLAEVARE